MADEKHDDSGAASQAGPKLIMGLPLPLFLFFAVNALVMIGGLAFIVQASLFYKKPAITESQVKAEIQRKTEKRTDAETGFFVENYPETTINLRTRQGGKNHYATVEVSLVCSSQNCLDQLRKNRAKVDDAINSAVAARSYTELQSLEVKYRIKHEILSRVNSMLKESAVTEVLFTSFIVQ